MRWSSAGKVTARSAGLGSRGNSGGVPGGTPPAAFHRVVTGQKGKALAVGGRAGVRKGKRWISPLTLGARGVPQTFETSRGIRTTTQPGLECRRSRVVLKDLATILGFDLRERMGGAGNKRGRPPRRAPR